MKNSELHRSAPEPSEIEKVETFNPLWNNGEFLGPNAMRFKDIDVDNSIDEKDSQ